MAFTNSKRKRNEGTFDDRVFNKSHKRHHSDHAPKSILKQSVTADAPDLSTDEAPSPSLQNAKSKPTNTFKAQAVKKATNPTKVSVRASDSSADRVPAVKPSKLGTSRKIAQKQRISSSEFPSLNEHSLSDVDPTDLGTNATSKVALLTLSSPPLEKAVGEGDGSEDEEEHDKDGEDDEQEDDNDDEDDDEDDADPGSSSESSMDWASDAVLNSDGEAHGDKKKKETFKADNPNAFASSMAGILGYKLTRTQRANPILARSADAKEADEKLLDMKLEKKAKAEMKREKFNNGGTGLDPNDKLKESRGDGAGSLVGDVLGINNAMEGQEIFVNQQHEKELKKMAQKGVVKMFNAFTSVREKTVEASRSAGSRAKKEEKATEMTKEGWLEYVGRGAKGEV